jgi:hypothetical protein
MVREVWGHDRGTGIWREDIKYDAMGRLGDDRTGGKGVFK